tara:strand:+ start:28 stop:2832 length:2805 start_codon:yes stop_codon:yes gene_type:complete
MVKTTIRNSGNRILYEFDKHLSHDCVSNYNYRDKKGHNFIAGDHIIMDIVEELEEIIYYVESKLSDENTTMVYLQNWSHWSELGLKNWHANSENIDIALVSFLVPYIGLEWPKKEFCEKPVSAVPTAPNNEWNSHSGFIDELKKNNPNLKVLISYGGAGLGCCPGQPPEQQTGNFLAEQIKHRVKLRDFQKAYDSEDESGKARVVNRVIENLSYEIAEFVVAPDYQNIEASSYCREDIVYDINTPYTTSNLRNIEFQETKTNFNMSKSLQLAQLAEPGPKSCTEGGRIPIPINEPNRRRCDELPSYSLNCESFYDLDKEQLCKLDGSACIEGDKCSAPTPYDGVDFDYEIDFDFTHMVYALTNTAKSFQSQDQILEKIPPLSDAFARDLSNVIIRVMSKVDTILNPKTQEQRNKIISTVPFLAHFETSNLFNKGLKDISNSIDIVGIQVYNSGPFIHRGVQGADGICHTNGQEAFTEVLRNINDTVGLNKTILLLANKPEGVGTTLNNAGGGKNACSIASWAPDIELEPIKLEDGTNLYLKRDATCYLGGTWNNVSTEPKNDRQKNRYETPGHKIRHKPLIELDELVQSFNSLAHKVRNPSSYNFSVTPSNEEYYCGTDHKIACNDKILPCKPKEGCGEGLTCFKCPAPSPGPSPDPTTDKLQFRGMGYWSIAGDDGIVDVPEGKLNHTEEIKFASDIKQILKNSNNYKTSDFEFKYCEDIVPTGITELDNSKDEIITDLLKKKHGCPLIVNELTNINDIGTGGEGKKKGNEITFTMEQVAKYVSELKSDPIKIYAKILKESCNIDIGEDGNVLPCPHVPKSIIFENTSTNPCSYDNTNINSAATNENGIVVRCDGDSDTNLCEFSPDAHGTYKVAAGQHCAIITRKVCGEEAAKKCVNSFANCTAICNPEAVCPNLQVGMEIKYDCSLTGKNC